MDLGGGIVAARMGGGPKATIIGCGRCRKVAADRPQNDVKTVASQPAGTGAAACQISPQNPSRTCAGRHRKRDATPGQSDKISQKRQPSGQS